MENGPVLLQIGVARTPLSARISRVGASKELSRWAAPLSQAVSARAWRVTSLRQCWLLRERPATAPSPRRASARLAAQVARTTALEGCHGAGGHCSGQQVRRKGTMQTTYLRAHLVFFYPPTRGVQLATCSAAARRVKMIAGTYSSSAFRLRQRASLRRALARWPFCRHSGASRHVTHVACCACSLFRFRYNTASLLIACALWGKQWRKKGTPQAWLGYLPLVLRICLPEYSNFQSAPFYDTPRAASVSDVV